MTHHCDSLTITYSAWFSYCFVCWHAFRIMAHYLLHAPLHFLNLVSDVPRSSCRLVCALSRHYCQIEDIPIEINDAGLHWVLPRSGLPPPPPPLQPEQSATPWPGRSASPLPTSRPSTASPSVPTPTRSPTPRSAAAKQHQVEEETSVPSSISAKILREGLKQQQEEILTDSHDQRPATAAAPVPALSTPFFPIPNDDFEEEEDDVDGFDAQSEYDGGVAEIDEEDEKALAAFMSKDTPSKRTLGDIILQKIREKDAEVSTEGRPPVKLDNSIVELYKGVGALLSRYTNGKIPKAFKRIPSLECWADVLQLTEPENWSPNTVYQATRLFSSNMNAKNAVRFYEAILLRRVRNDISQN